MGDNPTFGERLVGLDFNPSGDPTVGELKAAFGRAIDLIRAAQGVVADGESPNPGQRADFYRIAIAYALAAQMFAVKAATWRE